MATSEKKGRNAKDIVSATVATRIANLVEDDIIQGILKPGERINEVALAQRYRVSRIPLREALRIVEGQGLVEIQPFSGAYVSELSSEELVDIIDLHVALESLALRLALPRLTPEDFRAAESIARKSEREPDAKRYLDLANDFYTILYGSVARRHLLDFMAKLMSNENRYLYAFFSALRMYQPDLPRQRDYVEVLKKKNLEQAVNFLKKWRHAQLEFMIQHMSTERQPLGGSSAKAKRTRAPRARK
ncbi:MAG TPA: GntR family transcriptional regulator [Candidatus Hydrogenedentes bacterium]|nr:GntR family transcriptional regulator [Candidatus Hydrogenedentota bacterium]